MVDQKKIVDMVKELKIDVKKIENFDREWLRLKEEQQKYLELKSHLYKDWKEGILSEQEYFDLKKIYEEKYMEIQKMMEQQQKSIQECSHKKELLDTKLKKMKKMENLEELNRSMLIHFIERITVYEDKRLCIEFRWQDAFDME